MQNFNFKKNPTVFEGRDDIFKKMCAKAIKGPSLARSVPKPLKGPSRQLNTLSIRAVLRGFILERTRRFDLIKVFIPNYV